MRREVLASALLGGLLASTVSAQSPNASAAAKVIGHRTVVAVPIGMLSVGIPVAGSQQEVATTATRGKMLRIDGGKQPELIPEYLIWRNTFLAIKERLGEPPAGHDPWTRDLLAALPTPDRAALEHEATAQAKRDEACFKQLDTMRDTLLARLGTIESPEFAGPINDLTLECRQLDLAARDRLLATFTDEGRAALQAFVEHQRTTTTVFVLARDLDFYKLPQ